MKVPKFAPLIVSKSTTVLVGLLPVLRVQGVNTTSSTWLTSSSTWKWILMPVVLSGFGTGAAAKASLTLWTPTNFPFTTIPGLSAWLRAAGSGL